MAANYVNVHAVSAIHRLRLRAVTGGATTPGAQPSSTGHNALANIEVSHSTSNLSGTSLPGPGGTGATSCGSGADSPLLFTPPNSPNYL